jgi:hypothetical protein
MCSVKLSCKTGLEILRYAAQFDGGCARGGMADAPDLGSGSERIGGSSPLARTSLPQEIEAYGVTDTVLTQETAEGGTKATGLETMRFFCWQWEILKQSK